MRFDAMYRLQLQPGFSFREARALVPYLRDLGISHLYLSPIMEARSGSTHGYDVVDPTRISQQLGGEEEFRRLADAGLGLVLDVVPNHMAASDENRWWVQESSRAKIFDWDPETGWHRRFFTIDDLVGVRVEDPDVFELTQRKALELVREDLVDGLRIDHPDGLADPRGYLARLRAEGVQHVWVEKILEPGEKLRDWPVEGTTGYEFANDVTALFVDPRGEEPLTRWYQETTGETRPFAEIAHEAKLELAGTDFRAEFDLLGSLFRDGDGDVRLHHLEEAASSLHVYRTYIEPWSGRVEAADRDALRELPEPFRRVLLLEEHGHDEFVTRFQQTTGPVMAKGVEDTAFYRYVRLTALNEVGGDPSRFSLPVEEFHDANLERSARFPKHLLATQTHDTKRSGDVRARIAALTLLVDEWLERRSRWHALPDPTEDELLWQTLAGTWPIARERIEQYMVKAMREAKRTTNWVEPNESHERDVLNGIRRLYAALPDDLELFMARLAEVGRRISLGMTLLKLTAPGVPDVYQGDELESLNLVDPDNRRAVDWEMRRRALDAPPPKLHVIRDALALRARRPFGEYRPVDLGPDVCAFTRGDDVAVVVPLRGQTPPELPGRWRTVLDPALPVRLLERG